MLNPIKYTTGSEALALKSGNFYIGTNDVGKGPTSTTGYYNGVDIPSGGYVIYMYNSDLPGNLSYHSSPGDDDLISFTNNLAGESFTTAEECLVYYAGQSDMMCFNRDYENIVTDGLVFNLDAGFTPSYPTSGSTWYDLSGNDYDGTLTNGPTFDSGSGGSIVFDGVDDYVTGSSTPINASITDEITIETFIYCDNVSNYQQIGGGQDNTSYRYTAAFNVGNTGTGVFGFDLEASSGQVRLTSSTHSANEWLHLVGTYDGTTAKFYINNTLQDTDTGTSGNVVDFDSILLGRDIDFPSGRVFDGKIANYKIYNRALTQTEITQNFNATKGRFGL